MAARTEHRVVLHRDMTRSSPGFTVFWIVCGTRPHERRLNRNLPVTDECRRWTVTLGYRRMHPLASGVSARRASTPWRWLALLTLGASGSGCISLDGLSSQFGYGLVDSSEPSPSDTGTDGLF